MRVGHLGNFTIEVILDCRVLIKFVCRQCAGIVYCRIFKEFED